jgi:hypothetical protein
VHQGHFDEDQAALWATAVPDRSLTGSAGARVVEDMLEVLGRELAHDAGGRQFPSQVWLSRHAAGDFGDMDDRAVGVALPSR